jgi:adenosylcobinamide-GDP ribazoletransferase
MLKREIESFFAALRFFTRCPVPAWVGHSQAGLDRAARYFPLVGALVGTWGALVSIAALQLWPAQMAVVAGMAATILATGAFHEDGLADTCDGCGGGWETSQVLAIMKDSRIGTYGAVGLVLALLFKFAALTALAAQGAVTLAVALIVAHAASRLSPVLLMCGLSYVRENDDAKAKPLARAIDPAGLLVASLCALAPLLWLPWPVALGVVLAVVGVGGTALRYFRRRIGGYTGDCLGATQQIAELAIYGVLTCACI